MNFDLFQCFFLGFYVAVTTIELSECHEAGVNISLISLIEWPLVLLVMSWLWPWILLKRIADASEESL